jgi:hypothetical protein
LDDLLAAAAGEHLAAVRDPFLATCASAVAHGEALLADDAERRGEPAGARLAGGLGGLAAQLVDAGALAGVIAHRKAGEPLDGARREALSTALEALRGAPGRPATLVAAPGDPLPTPAGFRRVESAEPLAAASAWIEVEAAALRRALRGLESVARELAGAPADADETAPGRGDAWLSLPAKRRALLPPVFVVIDEAVLRLDRGAALVVALGTGWPLQLVSRFAPDAEPGEGLPWDPSMLALGLREAFVQEGCATRGAELVDGFRRALGGARPGFHRVAEGPEAFLQRGLAEHSFAEMRYDPDAGEAWSERLALATPPVPELAVAAERPAPRVEARRARWRALQELAGLSGPALEAAAAAARAAAEGVAAAERAALEARHVAEIARLHAQAESDAVDRLVGVLVGVDPALLAASEPLAAALGGDDVRLTTGPRPTSLGTAVAPSAAAAVAPATATAAVPLAPAVTPANAGNGHTVAAPVPTAPVTMATVVEPWIDTELCTSCDECTRLNPRLFAYNENKQAYIKDPRGGTFEELVRGAERCTARIIHPGTPLDPGEPDLETWIRRAEPFNA